MGPLPLGLLQYSLLIFYEYINTIVSKIISTNHIFLYLMLILILCSWRALRVQKSPNTDESPTTSQEAVSSPAPSVSVSNTSWLEGFDDENGEEMDLEELSKALSEAATSASQSKKPQSKHHSMSNAKPTPVSPRTSMMDSSRPGMVITWIKT